MNFRKSSKGRGGGGVIFNPKIYVADFGPLYRAFFGRFPKKKYDMSFRKCGGRVKGRLELFQKIIHFSSVSTGDSPVLQR